MNENLWCTQEEAVKLAALQCQVQFGDYNQSSHLKDLKLSCFLPKVYIKVKHVTDLILAEYRKMNGISETMAKLEYIEFCKSLPLYGVTFFLVWEKPKGRNRFIPCLLGIKRDAIFRANLKTKTAMTTWPFTMIKRWAASQNIFIIDFGPYSDEFYSVATTEGENISEVLSGYIDCIARGASNRLRCFSEKQVNRDDVEREISVQPKDQKATTYEV